MHSNIHQWVVMHWQRFPMLVNDFPTFLNALATFPNILIPKAIPLWLGNYKHQHIRTLKIHCVLKQLQTTSPTHRDYTYQGSDRKDPIAQLFRFPTQEKKTEKSNIFFRLDCHIGQPSKNYKIKRKVIKTSEHNLLGGLVGLVELLQYEQVYIFSLINNRFINYKLSSLWLIRLITNCTYFMRLVRKSIGDYSGISCCWFLLTTKNNLVIAKERTLSTLTCCFHFGPEIFTNHFNTIRKIFIDVNISTYEPLSCLKYFIFIFETEKSCNYYVWRLGPLLLPNTMGLFGGTTSFWVGSQAFLPPSCSGTPSKHKLLPIV